MAKFKFFGCLKGDYLDANAKLNRMCEEEITMTKLLQSFHLCGIYTIGNTTIVLNEDATILDAYLSFDSVHILALVDSSLPTVPKRFHVSQLWNTIPDNLKFIASVFRVEDGYSIFIFEYLD